jgi:hypothetical protein
VALPLVYSDATDYLRVEPRRALALRRHSLTAVNQIDRTD